MPVLAGLTTYGISYAGLWAAVAAGIMPEELQWPLIFVWSIAGLALAVLGIVRAK